MELEEMKALLDRELPGFTHGCVVANKANRTTLIVKINDPWNDLIGIALAYAKHFGLAVTFTSAIDDPTEPVESIEGVNLIKSDRVLWPAASL